MRGERINDQENRIERRTILRTIGAAGLLSFAGCTETSSESDEAESLNWLTPAEDEEIYALCLEFKEILEELTGYRVNMQSSEQANVEVANVAICEELRDNDSSEFGVVRNDVAHFAATGTGLEAFENNPAENLRGCATLYPEAVCILVRPDGYIQSIEDLEGATINIGRSNSATRANARLILESLGLTPEDYTERNGTQTEWTDWLVAGEIDAAIIIEDWPSEFVADLLESNDIDLLSFNRTERKMIIEAHDWYVEDTISGGTYPRINDDLGVISCRTMIITRDEVRDEEIDEVTTTIFENTDQLETKREFISSESATDGMSIESDPVAREALEQTAADDGESESAEPESGAEESTEQDSEPKPEDSTEPTGQESDPESETPEEPTGQESEPSEPESEPEPEEPSGQESDPGSEEPVEPAGQESESSEPEPESEPEEPTEGEYDSGEPESEQGPEEPTEPTNQSSEPNRENQSA